MNFGMNENVDIFIGTHKNYMFPTNQIYKIIYNGDEQLNTNLKVYYEENEPLHDLFADAMRIEYIAKNIQLKKYVGLVQYRRHFSFYNNVPNIEEIFTQFDGIIPSNHPYLVGGNVYDHWCYCMGTEPIHECLDIIKELYPNYPHTINDIKNIKFVNAHSIFILKSGDFKNLYTFTYDIFNKYIKNHNFKTMSDVYNYVIKYYGGISKTNFRICGYLSELLCSIWYMINLKNPKHINIIDT